MKLTELFQNIADTIRGSHSDTESKIKAAEFPDKIAEACDNREGIGYDNGYSKGHYAGYNDGKDSMIDRSKVIEKTANGNPVTITDASELPHNIGVKVNSKNLWEFGDVEFVRYKKLILSQPLTPGTYTMRAFVESDDTDSTNSRISLYDENGEQVALSSLAFSTETVWTFSTTKNITYLYLYASSSYLKAENDTCKYSNVQIEKGTTATDYTPFVDVSGIYVTLTENGNTYTTDINGEFECESVSPNMTFTCDDAVDIEVNYWKSYGMDTEQNRFWDTFQNNGNRKKYQYAFMDWNCEYIKPKYKVTPTEGGCSQLFYGNRSLKKVESEYFDFSQLPTATYANLSSYYTFQFCSALKEIEDINLPGDYYTGTFHSCTNLHTIAKLKSKETTTFTSNPFHGCTSLENIIIDGVICNNVSFEYSSKLTLTSLRSILTALSKDSAYASSKTVTFNTASRTIIEGDTKCSEQMAQAVNSGWTIAYN